MRILDEQDTELESYDEAAGYVTEDVIVIAHHDAVEAVAAVREKVIDWQNPDDETNYQYHWETVTPATPARAAYDETETVLRYHAYTEDELAEREAQAAAAAEAAEAAAKLQADLEALPNRTSDIEGAVNDLMDAVIELAALVDKE